MYNSFNDWGFSDSSNFLITISQMLSDSEGGVSTDDVVELINSSLADIEIDGQDLEYTLKVKGNNKGQIIIPKDNYLKDVQYQDGKLNFTFELADGAKTVDVDLSSLNDKKYVDDTISVTNKNVATLNTNLVDSITKMNESIATINQNLVDSVNTINGGIADEISARKEKENELEQSIEAKANSEDVYSKEEVDDKIASAVTEGKIDLSGYVTTKTLTEDLAKKVDSETYEADKETFALKSDVPDVTPYETSEHAETTYQVKGDYATKEEIPVVPSKLSEFENDSEFITTSQVAEEYQPKGEYLTEHQDLSEYAKTTDVEAKVAEVNESVEKKQDIVYDIDTIREGATLGKTALQEVPEEYAKKEDIPTDFYSKAEIDATVQSLNDLINEGDESLQTSIDKKQSILTAGDGISIENDVISSTLDVTLYKVVDSLPTEDINDNKIYLMLSNDSADNNVYTEYIHVNGKWEIIGEYKADVDLSAYLKSEEAAKIYATQDVVTALDANVIKNKTDVETALQTKADKTEVYSIEQSDAKIAEVKEVADKAQLTADSKQDKGDYITNDEAKATYATIETVDEVKATTESVSETVDKKAAKEDVENNSNELIALKATLESYKAMLDQMRKDFNTYSSNDFGTIYTDEDGSLGDIAAVGKNIRDNGDTIKDNCTIVADNIILNETVQDGSVLKFSATRIEANDVTITGDMPRSTANSYHIISDAETVIYNNLTFTATNAYNGIEIGLKSGLKASADKFVVADSSDTLPEATAELYNSTKTSTGKTYLVKDTEDEHKYNVYIVKRTGSSSSYTYSWVTNGAYYMDNILPKTIIFENCDFGDFKNNAINIFGVQDGATITISNCHFASVSNALRFSNRTNAKNITINFVNCTIDAWEHREGMEAYTGAIIFEDYNSLNTEEVDNNRQFASVTLNITNLIHDGQKVMPTDIAAVLGTQDANQVMYVSADYYELGSDGKYYEKIFPYSEYSQFYPTVNFK